MKRETFLEKYRRKGKENRTDREGENEKCRQAKWRVTQGKECIRM